MNKTKIAFFGSSKFSLPYLELLNRMEGLEIALVVSQPDKSAGRGLNATPTPVKTWAKENNILVLTPTDLREALFLGALKTLPLALGLCAYYGLIVPGEVISHFPKGILNVHHSLLPKHRGANPIPWSILSGESKTGTTLIKIDERIDAGLILGQEEEEIRTTDTTETLRIRLDQKALLLLERLLPEYLSGRLVPKIQNGKYSYDAKITKERGKVDWNKNDEEIERLIRAFDPWPGAWTVLSELLGKLKVESSKFKVRDQRVKILKSHLDGEKNLVIDQLQIEGGKPMDWKQFLSGYRG